MPDFPGLFDSLEADQTQQRVASRRAVALADVRVSNKLGQFLRGARDEDEFLDRLALVQDDFDWYVKSASEEVGYDHPEYIGQSIARLYKEAIDLQNAQSVDPGIANTPVDTGALAPQVTPYTGPAQAPIPANPAAAVDPQAVQSVGAPGQDPNAIEGLLNPPRQAPVIANQVISKDHWIQKAIKHPGALHRELGVPEGEKIPEDKLEEAEHSDNPKERERADFAKELEGFNHHHHDSAVTQLSPFINANVINAMANWLRAPEGTDPHVVLTQVNRTYPGGVEGFLEQNGMMGPNPNTEMPDAPAGVQLPPDGMMPQESPLPEASQMPPAVSSWRIVAEDDDNTDLGGPEPKMDKRKQDEDHPEKDVLGDEDKGTWPTKHKDVTESIIRENREVGGKPHHVLKEIGEQTTERIELPAATGDEAGFADGDVNRGPHTKTFKNRNQTDPVTKTSLD